MDIIAKPTRQIISITLALGSCEHAVLIHNDDIKTIKKIIKYSRTAVELIAKNAPSAATARNHKKGLSWADNFKILILFDMKYSKNKKVTNIYGLIGMATGRKELKQKAIRNK